MGRSKTKARIAVVGGGITGAFSAYFLARLGAAPMIIERDGIGGQASGRNAGGLNPLHGPGIPGPMSDFALQSLTLHLEQWPEIERLSGTTFGARLVPRVLVAMNDEESRVLREREALHNRIDGFSARWLSGREARAIEPRLSEDVVGALWTEGNARVDPAAYTKAVVGAAVALGAEVVLGEAQDLDGRDGKVTGVRLDGEVVACDGAVIATGPWCESPARWLGLAIPVEPLKGELLLATPTGGIPGEEIGWGTFGIYSASKGSIWLGGTEERVGLDDQPTEPAREHILAATQRVLPGLGTLQVERHVAGLRPLTPDGRPIVGLAPGFENVALALGSGRKGMLFGAGLGNAAAELLVHGTTSMAIDACSPTRWEVQP